MRKDDNVYCWHCHEPILKAPKDLGSGAALEEFVYPDGSKVPFLVPTVCKFCGAAYSRVVGNKTSLNGLFS